MAERLNEQELARMVKWQKSRIYRLIDQVKEARDIANQLLFELRQHVDTPATHVDFYWLRDPELGESHEQA